MADPHAADTIEANRNEQLRKMDDTFLRCRELMHAWNETNSFISYRRGGRPIEITEILRCDRCGAERYDRLHATTYELLGRRYEYPEGYQLFGAGFTLRQHVRAEKFKRHAPAEEAPGATHLRAVSNH